MDPKEATALTALVRPANELIFFCTSPVESLFQLYFVYKFV